MRRKPYKSILIPVIAALTIIFNGCSLSGEPRVRLGSYATATPGTNFIDMNSLGRHSYGSFLFENNGIVYTCRGGHIDIAHVRIGADNVRYLYYKVRKNLLKGNREFTFKLNVEPSVYFVKLDYPGDWKSKPRKERQQIANELAMELSQYFTFTMTTWHEVLTWFGYKCMAVLPEQPSAFSWEDIYSNIVGIRIGAQAIQDRKHTFNHAVTIAIRKELEYLQVQSSDTARKASEKMRGKWYDGILLVDMRERNIDIGLCDGFVTPTLVPGECNECNDPAPQSYPVPTTALLGKYGFTMELTIEPKEFESGEIMKIIYPEGGGKIVRPIEHLPIVMDYIEKDALKRGYEVMPIQKREVLLNGKQNHNIDRRTE
jgi:hypothetical protein